MIKETFRILPEFYWRYGFSCRDCTDVWKIRVYQSRWTWLLYHWHYTIIHYIYFCVIHQKLSIFMNNKIFFMIDWYFTKRRCKGIILKKLVAYFIERSLLVNIISAGLIIAGVIYIYSINKEALPVVDYGYVAITTIYPGQALKTSKNM